MIQITHWNRRWIAKIPRGPPEHWHYARIGANKSMQHFYPDSDWGRIGINNRAPELRLRFSYWSSTRLISCRSLNTSPRLCICHSPRLIDSYLHSWILRHHHCVLALICYTDTSLICIAIYLSQDESFFSLFCDAGVKLRGSKGAGQPIYEFKWFRLVYYYNCYNLVVWRSFCINLPIFAKERSFMSIVCHLGLKWTLRIGSEIWCVSTIYLCQDKSSFSFF